MLKLNNELNKQLHNELLKLRKQEKHISAQILEKLQLIEDKRSYLPMGYSSLFDYLTRGLDYSSSRAYERQSCLKLTRELPELKEKIDQGQLSYSTITKAFKTLNKKTTEEKRKVLKSLENKSAREVKILLTEPMKPIQIKRTTYQEKVVLRLELSHNFNEKLDRLKALKSHQGDLEILLEKLVDQELKKYESTNFVKSKSKNPRVVSRCLENYLLKKANHRCEYPGCVSSHFLQVDHLTPVSAGGTADPENLQILCSAHNQMKGLSLKWSSSVYK